MASSTSAAVMRPSIYTGGPLQPAAISWLAPRAAPSSTTSKATTPRRRPFQLHNRVQHRATQCRTFTSTPAHLGGRGAGHTVDRKRGKWEERFEKQQILDNASKQSSMRVRIRQMFRSDEVPEDLGLFPATLIMPVGPSLPGFLSLTRYKMEGQRAWKRAKDFFQVLVMKYQIGFRKHKLHLRKMAPTAMALHRQVYSAFADGDEAEIRKIATEGVRDKLVTRIQARPKDTAYYWDIVRYIGRARVVSHRASQMPMPEEDGEEPSMMRQAIVRITSIQRLTREDTPVDAETEGELPEPTESEKRVTEYVVLQKRVLRGEEEPWKFWGTVEPTKVEDFQSVINFDPSTAAPTSM